MTDSKRPVGGKGLATLRVSTDKQDLGQQRQIIQKWLDDYGLEVLEWFSDVGSRLEAYKREGFQALLKRVEKGDIDWVVVECLDRFGCRSPAEFGKFICHLQDYGVKLYSVSEGIEATDDDAYTTISTTITGLRSTDELRARAHRSLKGKATRFKAGQMSGGPPPYGFDVICTDRLGVELWRLEYEALDRRIQHLPGKVGEGKQVRFDGPGNFPARNQGELARIVPARDRQRIEWVRKVFEWYTTEDISYRGIAVRLNDLGVDALNGKGWSGQRVKTILENPAYAIGAIVGNKSGRGKVLGLVGGREEAVRRVNGKTGRFTKRDETDYIYPDGEYEALISQETWNLAQNKNKTRVVRGRPARNPEMWLAGLVVCGVCDTKMAGTVRKQAKEKLNLCCSNHRHYGAASSCKLNRVPHRLVEGLLNRYLQEAGMKLDLLHEDPLGALRALRLVSWSRSREYLGTLAQMEAVLREAGIITGMEIDGQYHDCCDLRKEYRRVSLAREAELAEKIQAKEEELRGYVRNIPKLSSELAIKLAEEEMEKIGAELVELKRLAVPLDEQADRLKEAIKDASRRIGEARAALDGSLGRHKAEAVRKVVKRVVLWFEPVENPKPQELTSRLVRAVIEPLEGDELSIVVPDGKVASQSSTCHQFLSRVFSLEEISQRCQTKSDS